MKRNFLVVFASAAVLLPAFGQEADPDRRKNAQALFTDGLRAETERPVNLALAIVKYKKSLAKAKDEKNNKVAAEALIHIGWCNEKLEPENITDAQAAYASVVSDYPDVEKCAGEAKDKVSWKGVDVWLRQLFASLDGWRVTNDRSPLASAIVEKKEAIKGKILPLSKEAIPGLIWGLGHPDEVIRNFAAECLAEVIDEPGIATLIGKLGDGTPSMRAGVGTALQKIYRKYNEAADLERRASNLEQEISIQVTERTKAHNEKLAGEAAKLRKSAADIRVNIPASLDTPAIQAALDKLLGDESANPQARRDAAQAIANIGMISGALTETLLKGMDSKDHNVREACCRAARSVDTAQSSDKHKLADRLIKALMYEPAKDENKDAADWANDEEVRQASAEALQQIGLVKSLPALIKALDDNDTRVRYAAFVALNAITHRDLEYEKDDKGVGKTYEADKPLAERKKAQAKWEEWWKATSGIVVLVERFWIFQSGRKEPNLVKLFYPLAFLKEVESRKWDSSDPKADQERAERILKDFQRLKDVFVQDAVDIGPEALDQLTKFIGGETEKEPKPSAATRAFVAEASAQIVVKRDATDGVTKLREILISGDNAAKKTGGAMSLGFLGKDKVTASERQALQQNGLGAGDAEVKEAAANSLSIVGDDGAAADLTKAALDADQNVSVAALRALVSIHPKNADTIKTLGDMIADEQPPGTPSKKILVGKLAPLIREYAAEALGEIRDSTAMESLLRARRDEMRNVREAAIQAVQKVHTADPKASSELCLAILKDEKKKTDDRIGAALCLGDMGDPALGRPLALRLTDENPPRVLRDQDPGVRIKICEALGNLKENGKTLTVIERLINSMADDNEREAVRDAAYGALRSIRNIDPEKDGSPDKDFKFKASEPKTTRDAVISKWRDWFSGEKGSLKDPV
jgi:HEAT repeat protein